MIWPAKINAHAHATAEAAHCFRVRRATTGQTATLSVSDTAALPRMAELFRGKTGICDHQWSADRQIARI